MKRIAALFVVALLSASVSGVTKVGGSGSTKVGGIGTTKVDATTAGAWVDVVPFASTTTSSAYDPAFLVANLITLPTGTATKLRAYVANYSSGFNIKLGLYDNSNAKLAEVAVAVSATGYVEGTISQAVTSGTYRILFIPDAGGGGDSRYQTSMGTRYYQMTGVAYYTLPNPFVPDGGPDTVGYAVGVFVQ